MKLIVNLDFILLNFNSTLVRLTVYLLYIIISLGEFQFHIGAINS